MDLTTIFLAFFLGLQTATSYAGGQVENLEVATAPGQAPETREWNIRRHTGPANANAEPPDQRPLRDPFSPIGYLPPDLESQPSASEQTDDNAAGKQGPVDFHGLSPEDQAIIMKHLNVGGFLRQNDIYIVIINNQLLSPGDIMELTAIGKKYRFLVKKITPDNVVLHSAE